jgi:2-keto-4-pentenoate hydratase/2-oxohepta-3-ene-1,7-dioic acid hydratase in catechol pathway
MTHEKGELMFLLTFKDGDALRLGVKTANGVIDVTAANKAAGNSAAPESIDAVLAGGADALAALSTLVASAPASAVREEASLTLGPSVPNPTKVICIGLNYRRHAEETNSPIPETPVIFSKFNNSIAAHGEDVPLPPVDSEYDYEVELGVVIGKTAHDVSETVALEYVFGYTTANDLSARELQRRTTQWVLGKTLDKFLPIGPHLVSSDEVGDPQNLAIKCWVNGDLRQNSNTGDMIFTVAQLVSYLSKHFTLTPGDVIITGTPEGVAMGRPDKPWLKAGDVVEVEVEKLGKLTNRMVG